MSSLERFLKAEFGAVTNTPPKVDKGQRVVKIVRGIPGSGKTWLANNLVKIAQKNGLRAIRCSADTFFEIEGKYKFVPEKVQENHKRCQDQVEGFLALNSGGAETKREDPYHLVIVDNTHILLWEMKPYVESAVRHGYKVEFCVPDTKWRNDPNQCFQKCTKGVPLDAIKAMNRKFIAAATVDSVLKSEIPERAKYKPPEPAQKPAASKVPDAEKPTPHVVICREARDRLWGLD